MLAQVGIKSVLRSTVVTIACAEERHKLKPIYMWTLFTDLSLRL